MEKVIEDVKVVNWGKKNISFSNSVWSIMTAREEQNTIEYILGISGGAFFHFWNLEEGDDSDITLFGNEVFERTFFALGYEYTYLPVNNNEQKCIELIVHSIDNNIPILAKGLQLPPYEYSVISGYKDDGKTIIIPGTATEDELIYKVNWTEDCKNSAILLLNKTNNTPEPDDILNSTLEWIIKLARKTVFSHSNETVACANYMNGLFGFEAMIYDLEYDDNFPLQNDQVIQQRCLAFGSDTSGRLEAKRKAGAAFFRQMAEIFPDSKDDLIQIADLYSKVSHLWGRIKDSIPLSYFPLDEYMIMADKKFRLKLAEQIKAAKDIEEYGIEKIQKLLNKRIKKI